MSGHLQVILYERERQEAFSYLRSAEQAERCSATIAAYRHELIQHYCPGGAAALPHDLQSLIVSYLDHSLPIGATLDCLSAELQWRQAFVMDVALYAPPATTTTSVDVAPHQHVERVRVAPPALSAPLDEVRGGAPPNLLLTLHYETFRGWPRATDELVWCDSERCQPPLSRLRSHTSRTECALPYALARDGISAAVDVYRALGAPETYWPHLHAGAHVGREMRARREVADSTVTAATAAAVSVDAFVAETAHQLGGSASSTFASASNSAAATSASPCTSPLTNTSPDELARVLALVQLQVRMSAVDRSIEQSL